MYFSFYKVNLIRVASLNLRTRNRVHHRRLMNLWEATSQTWSRECPSSSLRRKKSFYHQKQVFLRLVSCSSTSTGLHFASRVWLECVLPLYVCVPCFSFSPSPGSSRSRAIHPYINQIFIPAFCFALQPVWFYFGPRAGEWERFVTGQRLTNNTFHEGQLLRWTRHIIQFLIA